MKNGCAHADSFVPVRQFLTAAKDDPKAIARMRAKGLSAGRWELVRPAKAQSAEELLNRALEHSVIVCRETISGLAWPDALELLRIWEYTGKVRRGYFVEGLSGAQYIGADGFSSITAALAQPGSRVIWLSAADPAQAWGRVFKHIENRAFTCVPGTIVCLCGGRPVAVLERQGRRLRVFDPEFTLEAISAFVRDFSARRVLPADGRVVIKEYPAEAEEALSAAGFDRVVSDYILYI
jgi:ATP-dependent Lhr-like helicase